MTEPTDSTVINTATVTATVPGFPPLTATDDASVAIVAHPSSLAGSVYVDANNNGVRDAGEVGIGGVAVTLAGGPTDSPSLVSMTTVTAADGSYLFDVLPAGTYTITETAQPAGYTDSTDMAGTAGGTAGNDVITDIVLAADINATGYTFGERLANQSSFAGAVYVDSDNNGVRDVVTVTANPGSDTLTVPAGSGRTYAAGDAVTFSNTGGTLPAPLVAGTTYYVVSPTNGGLTFKVSATRGGGAIKLSTTGTGTNFVNDAGISGVTVKLVDGSNNLLATTVTDATGAYSFTGMSPGTYRVVEVQPSTHLDGIDTLGTGINGVTVSNDIFSNVVISSGGNLEGAGYNFGELAVDPKATTTASKAFNSTAIAPGNTIWFSSAFKMSGLDKTGTADVNVRLVNSSITLTTKAGVVYTIPVPDALITFTSTVTDSSATTTFDSVNNLWTTTVGKTTAGQYFLGAVPWVVPAGVTDLAGASMRWTGTFLDDSTLIDVSSWAGAAAVYNTISQPGLPADYNFIGVKPVDGSTSQYPNTDKAGSPENVKTQVIAGALGNGGTAYIGSYTGNQNPTDAEVPNLTVLNPTETFQSTPVTPQFLAAGGVVLGAAGQPALTDATLAPLVDEAMRRWAAAGAGGLQSR